MREEIETPVTAVLRRVLVNRLVLVAISMLAIVCATGYFVWQSRMKEDARVSLPAHLESGAAALRAGNVSDAAADYQQAARDVDRLGRHDAEALAIRQKARELNAVVNLSPVPLYEICEQLRSVPAADRQKWGEKLGELYRHTWFVVEGDVVEETGPDGRGQPLIRFPFPIDSAPAPVVFDARLTALSTPTGEAGSRHVIFAGQLASLTREGSKNHPPLWVLRLNDATAFLWAGIDTYQALGVVPENPRAAEETRRLLNQQAASLGIKP